jgi:hypothetical protein
MVSPLQAVEEFRAGGEFNALLQRDRQTGLSRNFIAAISKQQKNRHAEYDLRLVADSAERLTQSVTPER